MKENNIRIISQLVEQLEGYIEERHMKPHEKLLGEDELCRLMKCNRTTLRTAVKRLVNEGILYHTKEKGTCLSEKRLDRNLWQFSSFSNAMKNSGYSTFNKFLSIRIIEANKKLAGNLKLPLGAEIYEIKRVRYVENRPLAFETSYVPRHLCIGLETYDFEEHSLYEVLELHYKIYLEQCNQEIFITYATEQESEWLEVEEGTSVLMLQGVAIDKCGEPIEFSKAITRGDRCAFHSILK